MFGTSVSMIKGLSDIEQATYLGTTVVPEEV